VREVLVSLPTLALVLSSMETHTKSTLPFPLSFTLSTKDSSKPVVGSDRVRNAWCGRVAFFPSVVVSCSFSVSLAANDTDLDNGVDGFNLEEILLALKEYESTGSRTCLLRPRRHQHLWFAQRR
jgi:hypothetical protein